MRFDEVELEAVPLGGLEDVPEVAPVVTAAESTGDAARWRRMFALLTDLSLFAALVLALSPLLPQPLTWMPVAALAGFVVVLSYYYFVGAWLLWGKTVGGAIFEVRVAAEEGAMTLRDASMRWAAVYLSLALGGLGFVLALLPSRRSLPDRLSHTHCVL
ncbi:MAG TPA: RDD family protein [Thermoanaerobaculia bacterium]|nr:RDD family protein [Thermoanaerobaculia bacterium]